jgi:hypothetical protein
MESTSLQPPRRATACLAIAAASAQVSLVINLSAPRQALWNDVMLRVQPGSDPAKPYDGFVEGHAQAGNRRQTAIAAITVRATSAGPVIT